MKSISRANAVVGALCLTLAGAFSSVQQDPKPQSRIEALFPRTSNLVDHVRRHDPDLYVRLEEYAQVLAQNAERESTAFVAEHHPELAQVLERLKAAKKKRAYVRAMNDVVRDVTRLRQTEATAPEMFPAALEAWKNRSRLRLRGARIAMMQQAPNAEAEAQLEDLVRRTVAAERRQLEIRLKRVGMSEHRIRQRLASDFETEVAEELQRVRTRIERRRKNR